VPREQITSKATRLLRDQRLQVKRVDRDTVEAVIRGDHGEYELGHRDGRWWCSCPARVARCAHLDALQRVTCPTQQPIRKAA
jgi:hypothetical protein